MDDFNYIFSFNLHFKIFLYYSCVRYYINYLFLYNSHPKTYWCKTMIIHYCCLQVHRSAKQFWVSRQAWMILPGLTSGLLTGRLSLPGLRYLHTRVWCLDGHQVCLVNIAFIDQQVVQGFFTWQRESFEREWGLVTKLVQSQCSHIILIKSSHIQPKLKI